MTHVWKKRALMAGVSAVALALVGCGQAPNTQTSGEGQSSNGQSAGVIDVKACMVAGLGGLMDKSFNQSGYEGLTRAQETYGVEIEVVETFSDSDYVPAIDNMAQGGCDVVFGVSYMMADAMDEAAVKYPDVKFALVDSNFPNQHDNSKGIIFNTAEASYLSGYAAAALTRTGKVGTFLGGKMAPTMLFADGFADGIAKYNEVHGTTVELLGWDKDAQDGMATGDFEDVPKGKQFAEQLIQQGADILLPVAGVVSTGALAAATESDDTWVIWVDTDGFETESTYADIILTSVMKEIGNAVFDTVTSVVEDSFSNDDYIGSLANEGVGLAPWHGFADKITPELQEEIDALKADIISGKIRVESPSAP